MRCVEISPQCLRKNKECTWLPSQTHPCLEYEKSFLISETVLWLFFPFFFQSLSIPSVKHPSPPQTRSYWRFVAGLLTTELIYNTSWFPTFFLSVVPPQPMPSTPFINTASYVAKIFLLLSSVNFGSTCFDMSSTVVLDRGHSVCFVCLTVQHTRGYRNPIRTHGLRTKYVLYGW